MELLHSLNPLSPDDDVVKDQVVDQPVRHAPQHLGLLKDARGGDGYVLWISQLSVVCRATAGQRAI